MDVIDSSVIDDLWVQYDEGSDLWQQYPEMKPWRGRLLGAIAQDMSIVRAQNFTDLATGEKITPVDDPVYLTTGGAPLVGKTTVLSLGLQGRANFGRVDPDLWGIQYMIHTNTILRDAGVMTQWPEGKDHKYAQVRAYDIARPASNAFAFQNLNRLVGGGYNVAHGASSTSKHMPMIGAQAQGYFVEMLVTAAPDKMRLEAAKYRSDVQANHQANLDDIIKKGKLAPQCMATWFETADILRTHFREKVTGQAVVAAEYTQGARTIKDGDAHRQFSTLYEQQRDDLRAAFGQSQQGQGLPTYAELEQLYKDGYTQRRSSRQQNRL